jgi:nucleoside-diphosphate-sugar epimerase
VRADDVVRAAVAAADADIAIGHAYNLAGPPVTHLEFVQALARAAGCEAQLVHVPRARIQAAGGGSFAPPFYFGIYLDIPPITVRGDRLRSELQLELTPLEEGLRETYLWYERQQRPPADYSWEDDLIAAVGSRK